MSQELSTLSADDKYKARKKIDDEVQALKRSIPDSEAGSMIFFFCGLILFAPIAVFFYGKGGYVWVFFALPALFFWVSNSFRKQAMKEKAELSSVRELLKVEIATNWE